MLNALKDLNIPSNIVSWIGAMLSSCIVQLKLGSSKVVSHACRGKSQGGVLSPLFWNKSLNKILKNVKEFGWEVVTYAEDRSLFVRGFDSDTIRTSEISQCFNEMGK